MSRESTAKPPPPRQQASTSQQPPQDSSSQNPVEEDDSDFVLVTRKKQNHQQNSTDSYRKHRQSYDHHTDDDHQSQNSYQGRRRKYRDRGGGDQKDKGFRRRDKDKSHRQQQDKENIKTVNSTGASSPNQQNQQTLPPPVTPPPPQQPQISTPSGRSFSLVVASGSVAQTGPPPPQYQKSTQTESVVLPQPPQQISLSDQSNDQDSPVRLTNRQILMVIKPKQESLQSGGPSTSSSIPDTSSLTSEETLDSVDRKTSADAESNEGSSINNGPNVEYVDAPVPKINPWVANRNAAQMITGSNGLPTNVALNGFPSVSETINDQPEQQVKKVVPQQQKPRGKEPSQQDTVKVKPPSSSPTSFSEAVISPKQKQEQPPPLIQKQKPRVNELPKKLEQLPLMPGPPPPPLLPLADAQPSVYIREMSNGFRPGRGRGSYSASASAGRKIPSRSSALMKAMSSDNTSEDWPTLGEAVVVTTVTRAQKLSSSGGEESAGEKEDVVDSHDSGKQVEVNKSNDEPRKSPPPTQRQDSVQKPNPASPPPQQAQSQTETTSSSDNDDDINSPNRQRKGSKQKWVPLDMTASQAGGGGEQQRRPSEDNPPQPEYKKSGKGGGARYNKYDAHYYSHSGYQRAKGKENVAINGGNDYSDYNSQGHSHNQGRYQNPRRGPHHRSNPQINSSRGGGSNNSRSRRHQPSQHRSNSTLSLNNHSLMNGSHPPPHHRAEFIITSPTLPPTDFQDFPHDFTTLTPMYPAVSDFIMPYVSNGYFPTPFTPPPGMIAVEAGATTEVNVGGVPIVVASVAPPPQTTATQVSFSNGLNGGDITDLVRTQIEYYFSEENLAKDFYLRRKMDPEGYLPVHMIATFPRVKQMTQDYSTVLNAIQSSDTLELKPDLSSVRTSLNPDKWPIPDPASSSSSSTSPQHKSNNPSAGSSSSSESGSVIEPIPIKKCINNNNTPAGVVTIGGVETLNPNVPEFVPKSKIVLF